jgi:O-antigen/teichoic acid export membrane protein
MDLATRKPWTLMWRVTVLATSVGLLAILVLLVGGRPLIDALFGSEFVSAYPVLLVLIIAPLLTMLSFPLTPMLYALDRPDGPFKAHLFGTILYFAIVAPLSWRFGVTGAATAFVIGNVAMAAALAIQLAVEYRRVRAR